MLSGGLGGNLCVVCGNKHAAETTSMKIPTTTASSTTQLLRQSSVVLSTELIVPSSNSDVTMSTADILSEEIDFDQRIGTFILIYII